MRCVQSCGLIGWFFYLGAWLKRNIGGGNGRVFNYPPLTLPLFSTLRLEVVLFIGLEDLDTLAEDI